MHAFLPAWEGASLCQQTYTDSPIPALSSAVPSPRGRGAAPTPRPRPALPDPGTPLRSYPTGASAARHSAEEPRRSRCAQRPAPRAPRGLLAAAGTAPRAPQPLRPPHLPSRGAARPAGTPRSAPRGRAALPGTRCAPLRAAQQRSPSLSPQPVPLFIPILIFSFQICLPPPPPSAKPLRAYLGGAGGHARLRGRCLPAVRDSPAMRSSRSSPRPQHWASGAGEPGERRANPTSQTCAVRGGAGGGAAAARPPLTLLLPRSPACSGASPGTTLGHLLRGLSQRLGPEIFPTLLCFCFPFSPGTSLLGAERTHPHPRAPRNRGGCRPQPVAASPLPGSPVTSRSLLFSRPRNSPRATNGRSESPKLQLGAFFFFFLSAFASGINLTFAIIPLTLLKLPPSFILLLCQSLTQPFARLVHPLLPDPPRPRNQCLVQGDETSQRGQHTIPAAFQPSSPPVCPVAVLRWDRFFQDPLWGSLFATAIQILSHKLFWKSEFKQSDLKAQRGKKKKAFRCEGATYLPYLPFLLSWNLVLGSALTLLCKKCLTAQRGYSVLTVPPLGFEGLSETLIMFNYL